MISDKLELLKPEAEVAEQQEAEEVPAGGKLDLSGETSTTGFGAKLDLSSED
jgi:hypothetical protein